MHCGAPGTDAYTRQCHHEKADGRRCCRTTLLYSFLLLSFSTPLRTRRNGGDTNGTRRMLRNHVHKTAATGLTSNNVTFNCHVKHPPCFRTLGSTAAQAVGGSKLQNARRSKPIEGVAGDAIATTDASRLHVVSSRPLLCAVAATIRVTLPDLSESQALSRLTRSEWGP